MEERYYPPDGNPINNTKETYVIQFPRNQVYRIPPPENALIVKNHIRNAAPNQNKNKNCWGGRPLCWSIAALILLAIISGIIIAIIGASLYAPMTPKITLTNIHTRYLDRRVRDPPQYDIVLRADNRNERMSITYRDGGESSLIFYDEIIGKGGVTDTIRGGPRSTVDVHVVFSERGISISNEIRTSLNETRETDMRLKMEVPIEVNSWVRNQKMDLRINCDFKVQNLLKRNSRITSQDCRARF